MARRIATLLVLTSGVAFGLPGGESSPGESARPAKATDVRALLEQIGAEDRRVETRLQQLEVEASQVHALLLARGRSYAKMARAGLLPVGGGLEGLVEHASRLERLRRAVARDLERERAIASERITLSKQRATLGDRRGLLQTEHAALARSHTAILAAEEREEAFRRAFLGGGGPTHHTAVYGSGIGSLEQDQVAAGFEALRGRLPFPLEGRVEIRPTRWPGADGPGLEMRAHEGSLVRAVYPGRVAFADQYADYGSTVIVDHGGGFFTVSGNLGSIDVKVGDDLRAGDPLGRTGATPRGALLYFELRRGKETLNPSSWFGI